MKFEYSDGGRSKYFKASNVGDCVTRAIAIATGIDYKEVYDRLKELAKKESVKHHRGHKQSSVRDGVFKETWKKYLAEIGWKKVSTIKPGSSERVHLTESEIPNGTLIVQLSKHLVCVKDKVIYDTYDSSKKEYYDEFGDLVINEERLVYAYWIAPSDEEVKEKKRIEEITKKQKELLDKSLSETKAKIQAVEKSYKPKLDKLTKKIKELQHQLKIESNRMKREIEKIKKADGDAYNNKILEGDY